MAKAQKSAVIRPARNSVGPQFRRILAVLKRRGVLLVSDAALPSVGKLVARSPLRGSWWAHPQAKEIFDLANQLEDHPDVLTARLLNGKFTFIHRSLWRAVFAVGKSRESWQLEGISALARGLFAQVEQQGAVRLDILAAEEGMEEGKLGEAARELEQRLLVASDSMHTEHGSHTKRLESWNHLARRRRFRPGRLASTTAKSQLEAIATALQNESARRVRLPWPAA